MRIEMGRLEVFAADEMPITQKNILYGEYNVTGQAYVEISPSAACVAFGDVHPTYVCFIAVNDDQLAMVPEVDFAGEAGKADFKEWIDLTAGVCQRTEEFVFGFQASDIVVDESYLDAFFGFLYKCISDGSAYAVVFNDVEFHVDCALCLMYVVYKAVYERLSVGEHVCTFAVEGDGLVGVVYKRHDTSICWCSFFFGDGS